MLRFAMASCRELSEPNNFTEIGDFAKRFSLNYHNRTPKDLIRLGNAGGPKIERSLKRKGDFKFTTEEGVMIDSSKSNGMVFSRVVRFRNLNGYCF